MTPDQLRELVVRRRDACVKFSEGKPSRDRKEALQFYRGDNLTVYGDSGDGLSTVVSRDVMEAIEGVMPPLLRPFVAGEEVVSFEEVQPEDEAGAKQANEYINHVFRRHNNVLSVAQTALKDGLLFRLGVAKTVIEECEDGAPESFQGLTPEELAAMDPTRIAGDIVQDETGFSVTLAPKKSIKFRVHIIAPDEFLYEERLTSLSAASFLGHRKKAVLADLLEMGLDEKQVRALRSGKPTEEEDNRFKDEDDQEAEWADDDLARPVWVDECYVRCDYQGTGTLEWRKVLLGGSTSTLLSDEAVENHPYSAWTPIPEPHKLVGLSMFDLCRDVQIQKTALSRELLNAMYLANRPMREVLDGQVNIDDLLNPSVGGVVRVKQTGAVNNISTGGEAAFGAGLQMVEYQDSVREARTGVTRYNQGMDSNSLNKTATGMNIIASNSQQRQELIARQFGEFLKDIFFKLLELVKSHADPEEVKRLTGGFVPWPSEYDANVSVGLGTNNKDQLVGHIMALLGVDEKIIQLQGGIQGPLLTADNLYDKLKRLPEAMGMKGQFYTDPREAPPQPPEAQQDPLAGEKMKQDTELQKEAMRQQTELQKEEMRQQPVVVPFGAMS